MKAIGDAIARGVLAMAGRKSPGGGGHNHETDGAGSAGEAGEADGGDAAPESPVRPRGPRNPWLPGGEQPPRRSASIEDLFRPGRKGPRSGGPGSPGGGGFPRLPQRPDGKSWVPLIIGG